MAKYIRIGQVLKGKDDPGSSYIKMDQDVTLKKGDTLSLESKKQQLDGLAKAEESGKISSENAAKARESIEKIPDFVRFTIKRRVE